MDSITEITKYRAGYPGRDAMREKAEGVFGNEFKDTNMYERGSASAPSRTPRRLYKKGGKVNSYKQEAKELGGHLTDLFIPKEISITQMREPMRNKSKVCKSVGGAVSNPENRNFLSPKASVYEKDMLGERPSKKAPHINYESQMNGEKPVHRAKEGGRAPVMKMQKEPFNASESHVRRKFAAGGVAKIRHNQADARGNPIVRRVNKSK